MQALAIPLILFGYMLTLATSTPILPYSDDNILTSNQQQQDQQQQVQPHYPFSKRPSERYGFGLGRRAFTYTSGNSGVKRLPVYNFGLGKRGGNGGELGYGAEER